MSTTAAHLGFAHLEPAVVASALSIYRYSELDEQATSNLAFRAATALDRVDRAMRGDLPGSGQGGALTEARQPSAGGDDGHDRG